MNKNTSKKTGGSRLHRATAQQGKAALKPLTLTITIPGPAVPLFKAMAALYIANRPKVVFWKDAGTLSSIKNRKWHLNDFATFAAVRWLVTQESVEQIDKAVNRLMHRL